MDRLHVLGSPSPAGTINTDVPVFRNSHQNQQRGKSPNSEVRERLTIRLLLDGPMLGSIHDKQGV